MNITTSINKSSDFIKDYWSLLFILSPVLLLATKTYFNIPIYIMALIGLYRLIKKNHLLYSSEMRFIYILFFSIWLPMLFSLTDAINLPHSLKTTLPYLRFLFAAYFIIDEVKKKNIFNKLLLGLSIIISFWSLDALFQFVVGVDLFTYPLCHGVGGIFCPKGTLGHILAIFSPIYFEIVRRYHSRYPFLWFLILVFISIILLSQKRTAWLILLSNCGLYGAYLFYLYRMAALKILAVILPIILIIGGALITQYEPLNKKVNNSLGLLSGDYEQINKATALRLPIWETGINIYRSHWINGIGPRGFRYAYKDYASSDNHFVSNGFNGASHPHLIFLEIAIETGIFGLMGYLIFCLYLMRISWKIIKEKHLNNLPWLMCIMIAVLPYNVGLAFYGSYWSTVTWWIIIITACFAFSKQNKDT